MFKRIAPFVAFALCLIAVPTLAAQQIINRGSSPGDGMGDTLYVGTGKINSNFTDLYTNCPNLIAGSNVTVSGCTISSSGGGGGSGSITHPGYKSGQVVRGGPYLSSSTALSNNVACAYPIEVPPGGMTITNEIFRIATGVAGQDFKTALFTNSSDYPGTVIANSQVTISASSSGVNSTTAFASAITLSAGVYWIEVATQTTGATGVTALTTNASDEMLTWLLSIYTTGGTGISTSTSLSLAASGAYAAGLATPTAGMVVSNVVCPLVHFTIQ